MKTAICVLLSICLLSYSTAHAGYWGNGSQVAMLSMIDNGDGIIIYAQNNFMDSNPCGGTNNIIYLKTSDVNYYTLMPLIASAWLHSKVIRPTLTGECGPNNSVAIDGIQTW